MCRRCSPESAAARARKAHERSGNKVVNRMKDYRRRAERRFAKARGDSAKARIRKTIALYEAEIARAKQIRKRA